MKVADVKPEHVDDFLADVRDRKYVPAKRKEQDGRASAPGAANMCRAVLSKMFSYAESPALGWVQYDYGPRPKFPHPVRHSERNRMPKRKVTATPETLRRLAVVLDEMATEYPTDYGAIVKRRHVRLGNRIRPSMPVGLRRRRQVACIWTIFLTGSRVGEILNATAAELQGVGLQKSEHKTVRHIGDKAIPLPRRARELLAGLPPCPSGRLFGAIEVNKVWNVIRDKIGQPELTLRDARRSWASYARSLGVTIDQVADVFGHTDVRTTHDNYQFMQDEAKAAVVERVAEAILTTAGAPVSKRRFAFKRIRWRRGATHGEARIG
jgi:integrase